MKLSVQLYTLRKPARKDLYGTLCAVSAAGYHAVEAARVPFTKASAEVFRRCREESGLEVRSAQIKFHLLRDDFEAMASWMHQTGCGVAVVSVLPMDVLRGGEDALKRFCGEMNGLGGRYAQEGIRLAFHHHHYEFLKFGDRRGIDILLEGLDPKRVGFVSDTYWAQKAGANPVTLLQKMQGRLAGVHLRDFTTLRRGPFLYSSDCPVGSGLLDMAAILRQAVLSGAGYGAVEQNSRNPLEDIAASHAALEHLIAQTGVGTINF